MDLPTSGEQKTFDKPLCDLQLQQLQNAAEERDATRLSVVSGSHRGAEWLNALPLRSCGLHLNNEELRINVGLRLGCNIASQHCCNFCAASVTNTAEHALSCRFSKGRLPRHAECNEIISRAFNSAHVPSTLEPTGISRSDSKRPDGMTLVPWFRGQCVVWDFTCVDSLAASRIGLPSHAATEAEKRKILKYNEISRSHIFTPIACCTLGSWGEASQKFLRALGKRLIGTSGDRRAGCFLRQRLSVAIARGNATSILAAMQPRCRLNLPY